ncbi:MAG: 30S ribosomal protein S6 [Deltaproteobacteria bacterium]|nr:MAG: 30S ribosomal protein S6 [Deltaproteobacteria bacterium]
MGRNQGRGETQEISIDIKPHNEYNPLFYEFGRPEGIWLLRVVLVVVLTNISIHPIYFLKGDSRLLFLCLRRLLQKPERSFSTEVIWQSGIALLLAPVPKRIGACKRLCSLIFLKCLPGPTPKKWAYNSRHYHVHEEEIMRRYETIAILRPSAGEETINKIIDLTTGIIADENGSIIELSKWGVKKLAYLIKKESLGNYIFFDYAATPEAVAEIERRYRIEDAVIKYMTIKTAASISESEIEEASVSAQKRQESALEEEKAENQESSETAEEDDQSKATEAEEAKTEETSQED